MKVNDFSNIQYYNKIISIGNELLKFSLLVNYELLQFYVSFFDISKNFIVGRYGSNSSK